MAKADLTQPFKALLVSEANGEIRRSIESMPFSFLPDHEVLIKVAYAGLNYKDALSASGHKGVTKKLPHIPGVDASGVVVEDRSGNFRIGQKVICTSYDLGMNTPGGFGAFIRVPAAWVVPLPGNFDLRKAMVFGTAAYTAGLALYKMEQSGQHPEMGPIVVTGSTGGVGSMAVTLLRHCGYEVHAVTGKTEYTDTLKAMGASRVLSRDDVNDQSDRPLMRPQWAGGIDNVGGNTLVTLLKACDRNGSVASIGLVGGASFSATVYPFILNGVNLLGVDSAETPYSLRLKIWELLAGEWNFDFPESLITICDLDQVPSHMDRLLKGESLGRVVAEHV